jgi:hypothetical protein
MRVEKCSDEDSATEFEGDAHPALMSWVGNE